jgi:hypothetical protein
MSAGTLNYWANGNPGWIESSSRIDDSNRHVLVVRHSGTTVTFWIDGNLDNTVTGQTHGGSYTGVRALAARADLANGLDDAILDEVAIIPSALTDDQIIKLTRDALAIG